MWVYALRCIQCFILEEFVRRGKIGFKGEVKGGGGGGGQYPVASTDFQGETNIFP